LFREFALSRMLFFVGDRLRFAGGTFEDALAHQ